MSRRGTCLLVFAKAPLPARVKTRLAAELGAARAALLHRLLLRHTLEELCGGIRSVPLAVELWCAPHIRHPFFRECRRRYALALHRQRGRDLGARMHHAFTTALRRHRAVLLAGCDCPQLTTAHLRQAHAALAGCDAVLIPARDGGYVLVGLRRPAPFLFSDMPWGSSAVLAETRRRLRRKGYRWLELPPLADVDEYPDLLQLLDRAGDAPGLQVLARRLESLLGARRTPSGKSRGTSC